MQKATGIWIYNSRNYIGLLNKILKQKGRLIYNSRNYIGLLNYDSIKARRESTIVEII